MHNGGGGSADVMSASRAVLHQAPSMHHNPYVQQSQRRSPPPPHFFGERGHSLSMSSGYGHQFVDRQPIFNGPPPPSHHYERHTHIPEYDMRREGRYPAVPPPPPQYHQHTDDHFAGRDSYGRESLYDARMMNGGTFEQTPLSSYRPTMRQSMRSNDPYMGERTMRGPQVFYEKTSDQCPTYIGYIKSAQDAILLLSACDLAAKKSSLSPNTSSSSTVPPPRRVTRRLLDAERSDMVASGCVFAWDEKEAGMKRWTDGRVWSASRVSGCFLTYRELEARKKSNGSALDGPTSNQYKPEGLIKQSFSVTTASGRKLHVISYFTKRDVREGRLRRVSEDPRFVGEGGGEWGLQVDKEEYSFPDGQSRAPGQDEQQNEDEDGDDSVDGLNTPSPEARDTSMPPSRKRSLPDDFVQQQRVLVRPMMARKRSSSLSQVASSSDNPISKGSFHISSSSSNVTSVSSDSAPQKATVKSNVVRALISPTLPRESAIRASACDMHPTHSQDSANAVGALLSLAGNRPASANKGPSPLRGSVVTEEETKVPTASSGLGLTVKPSPERRDSDQTALDMFHVRL